MKSLLTTLLLAVFALASVGCSTVSHSTPAQVDTVAVITQVTVSNIVLPVLANNPKYEPALLAVAAGVDLAFAAGEVTPVRINSFLDTVALKYEMDAKTRLYVGSGLLDLLDIYVKTYGQKVASTTDPRVVTMLNAFRDGIKIGIARYHALTPAT